MKLGQRDTVTPSANKSLTYGHARPTLVAVSTTPLVIDEEVAVTFTLPRRCAEWLDIEAVKRKHLSGASKAAKSPIVVELIERAMVEPAAEKSKKARTEK